MKCTGRMSVALALVVGIFGVLGSSPARAQERKPNILVIFGE